MNKTTPNPAAEKMLATVLQEVRARIHREIISTGMSHTELSEVSGIPTGTLGSALGATSKAPSLKVLCRICSALDLQLYVVADD